MINLSLNSKLNVAVATSSSILLVVSYFFNLFFCCFFMNFTLSAMLPHFPCHPYFSAPICLHLLISTFALRKFSVLFCLKQKQQNIYMGIKWNWMKREWEKERKKDGEEFEFLERKKKKRRLLSFITIWIKYLADRGSLEVSALSIGQQS